MRALSGLDGAFLHLETPETPMHVASLHLFDLPAGYRGDFHTEIKRQMRQRIHLAPIFTRRLAPMPLQLANPVWVEADKVDLDYHVQRVTLPAPGTQAQLEDCAGRLHGELLDRSRPLWRVYTFDGLQSGQVGYYIKVHHSVIDGQAGVLLAQAHRSPQHAHQLVLQLAHGLLQACTLRLGQGFVVLRLHHLAVLLRREAPRISFSLFDRASRRPARGARRAWR